MTQPVTHEELGQTFHAVRASYPSSRSCPGLGFPPAWSRKGPHDPLKHKGVEEKAGGHWQCMVTPTIPPGAGSDFPKQVAQVPQRLLQPPRKGPDVGSC